MLKIHKKKRVALSAVMAAVFVLPALVFAVSKLVVTDNSFAVTYEIPDGYTTMVDPALYDCVMTKFRSSFPEEEVPVTGLTDTQLTMLSTLSCNGMTGDKITDTTGIEKMTSLSYIDLGSNLITSINLSNNPNLTYLDLSNNGLTSINLANNPNLTHLYLYSNQLSYVDLSHNTELTRLDIFSNNLAFLDLSSNGDLQDLALDNIAVYMGIMPDKVGSSYVYDLSGIDYIKDGYHAGNNVNYSINNTGNYSYNESSMLLTVNNAVGAGNEVQINGDVVNYSLKLQLLNVLDFDLNGGTGVIEMKGCQVIGATVSTCDVTISNIEPTRNGYTFLGWAESSTATSANYNPGDTVTLSGSKMLYAVWQEESTTVTLSFDLKGGQGSVTSQSCSIIATASSCNVTILSTIPSKNGYSFAGWSNSSAATSVNYNPGDSVSLTGNKTLYAVWTLVTDTVTLDFNTKGGNGSVTSQSCTVSVESPSCNVTIPSNTPSKNGYTFVGWAESSTATSPSYSAGGSVTLSSNKTLYAVWNLVTNTATLSFNANSGDGGVASQSCTVSVETPSCSVTIPSDELTREGYSFIGWAENSSATGADYEPGDSVSIGSNKVLYAVWRLNTTTLTLSFDLNGGEGTVAAQTCTISIVNPTCDVTIPSTTPTLEGFHFVGWEDTVGTAIARYGAGDRITLNGDMTVSAAWEEGEEEPGDDTPGDDTPDEEKSDIPVPDTSAPDTGANTVSTGSGAVLTVAIAPVVISAIYLAVRYRNRKNILH